MGVEYALAAPYPAPLAAPEGVGGANLGRAGSAVKEVVEALIEAFSEEEGEGAMAPSMGEVAGEAQGPIKAAGAAVRAGGAGTGPKMACTWSMSACTTTSWEGPSRRGDSAVSWAGRRIFGARTMERFLEVIRLVSAKEAMCAARRQR